MKSGICFYVSVSHPCDNGAATKLCAVRTAWKCVCVCMSVCVCVGVSQATSVCAISMFGWLGWPCYMATFHTAISFCLSVSASLSHTLPPHPCQPIIVFPFTASTQHNWNILWHSLSTGPCPFICLISSGRPLEVCVCLSARLPYCLSIHALQVPLCVHVCVRVLACERAPQSLGEL